ncbi:GGDEF domain-containing response regulator [Calothrix sp. 336/3]|uniref:GGDEF domain-containing response regulator n=1 Tax=Calothrix sp. 336/3 TaxID=1337936 RepID=UPI0004E40C8C|nr:PleD family two-component system response regulator [Calothrix sp. 336/3]AKG24111.1 regulator [Calothrix sp. 336/3]
MSGGISQFSYSTQPPLILIADDDRTMRLLLREHMEKEGYRVADVSNGKECVESFVELKPDLVLLDAVMPVMDGFACCQQLLRIARKNLADAMAGIDIGSSLNTQLISMFWDKTPILMITGLDDPDSVDMAFEVGATDYLTKPIHWAVLKRRVRRLLQQGQVYKQLEAANQALQQMANEDGLTGLANRRRFDQYLNSQWLNLAQEKCPLSLILCDIDFFKRYNDKYGHPAGDACLQKVGSVLREVAQKNHDLVARYGGEEFAVIMPFTQASGAVHVAASMQAGVRELKLPHSESEISQFVTLSLGIATLVPNFESSPTDIVAIADQALYQAKSEGRNRIILRQPNLRV